MGMYSEQEKVLILGKFNQLVASGMGREAARKHVGISWATLSGWQKKIALNRKLDAALAASPAQAAPTQNAKVRRVELHYDDSSSLVMNVGGGSLKQAFERLAKAHESVNG